MLPIVNLDGRGEALIRQSPNGAASSGFSSQGLGFHEKPKVMRVGPEHERPLSQLIEIAEPGIRLVHEWMREATNPVEELPGERAAGERALLALQVTSRSPMGALALETGGLLVDHGWLRILGGGHPRLPRPIHEWNLIREPGRATRLPGAILVGDDVLGGFFAINGGGIGPAMGHVYYFAPDSLEWEDVASSYSEWLVGMMSGDLEKFYAGFRWPDWQKEIEGLSANQGISVYPFLSTNQEPIGARSRRAVPIEELWTFHVGHVTDS